MSGGDRYDRGKDSSNPATFVRQADLPAHERLFADAGQLVASHRATTSSRTPGKVNEGTVYHYRVPVIPCPDGCGSWKTDAVPVGQHAPHWHNGALVNCVGKPL